MKSDIQNNSMIELGKIFSLDSGTSAFYENISFSYTIETIPFSKDPVSGIEKYPHDLYVVNVVWNELASSKASDGSGVEQVSSERKLYFTNIGDYQEFSMKSVKYELNLISTEKSKAEFILKEIVGLRQ